MAIASTNDRIIRKRLRTDLEAAHCAEDHVRILDELGLRHGACRIDIAVVNGFLHGYEIKSDSDTLERLPAQIETYSLVLDRATLVVGEKHSDRASDMLPRWWGLRIAVPYKKGVLIKPVKPSASNPQIDPVALAELLWRNEAAGALQSLGAPASMLRSPRAVLYRELAAMLTVQELRFLVRTTLKTRAAWRDQKLPSRDAGSRRPTPK